MGHYDLILRHFGIIGLLSIDTLSQDICLCYRPTAVCVIFPMSHKTGVGHRDSLSLFSKTWMGHKKGP